MAIIYKHITDLSIVSCAAAADGAAKILEIRGREIFLADRDELSTLGR
ncbi:MAG: hypothetical protein LBB38_02600 [Puniceicoccales bacterium]|nr:hypothetical protein [Puniceicoccales bacterium]